MSAPFDWAGEMTPGEWKLRQSEDDAALTCIDGQFWDAFAQVVTKFDENTGPGQRHLSEQGRANAAGIVNAVRLVKGLQGDGAVEALARTAINGWYHYTTDDMGVEERWQIAVRAIIAHLDQFARGDKG